MSLTTDQRYTSVAVLLHWGIAACILFNLATGFFMEGLKGEAKHVVVSLHASSGLTVLALSLLRIVWRLSHRPPPLDAHLSRLERLLAEGVHGLLYVLMLAVPLAGWAISSASTRKGAGAALWLLMPLPKIGLLDALPLPQKVAAHDSAVSAHQIGAWILLALLAGHVAGALKHQFIDRRPQFARMWFSGSSSKV
ncbi:cytochrome b [Novosphingobium terrae]|uniref:cytochrome b n=1 Tax=Novosphingobium terrae TaxID=2726189 RepID=UPI00197D84C7|nr:cytochrome b [Novosphingobium terrae]